MVRRLSSARLERSCASFVDVKQRIDRSSFRIYDVMTFELDVEELHFFVLTTLWIVIHNKTDCNAAVVLKDQEGFAGL